MNLGQLYGLLRRAPGRNRFTNNIADDAIVEPLFDIVFTKLSLEVLRNGLPRGSAQFMRPPVGSVYASDVPLGQSFFIMPTIYRAMITLTVENIIFNRIFVGPDEHAQSVHNASSLLES
jgi:hypothetical protein